MNFRKLYTEALDEIAAMKEEYGEFRGSR